MKLFLISVTVLFMLGASYVVYLKQAVAPVEQDNTAIVAEPEGEPAVTIVRTPNGYEPKEVTIKAGDIVLWKNESGDFHWPASDLHPTHGIYPEFDPLRPLADKEEWKFKFDKVGEWKFHDHIRANQVGVITVTQ